MITRLSFFAMIGLTFLVTPLSGQETSDHAVQRKEMVRQQIAQRGVKDPRVLGAMEKVLRHLFVPEGMRALAYNDTPLPIGDGQTISQPYIVAYMTEALEPRPNDRVLEIGTGSGYQAAVLAELVNEVYTIEILEGLGQRAERTLRDLGYGNVYVRIGDGYQGWPEKAPFDAIIVTCAPETIPKALTEQLKEGGHMIIPVGKSGSVQHLVKVIKQREGVKTKAVMPVRFVPMVRSSP